MHSVLLLLFEAETEPISFQVLDLEGKKVVPY
jgi:hypothetical protein